MRKLGLPCYVGQSRLICLTRGGRGEELLLIGIDAIGHICQLRGIALKASYVFLHQLDLVLTIFAMQHGLSELNPLMRGLLASPLQLVVAKFIIPLLIAWLIFWQTD